MTESTLKYYPQELLGLLISTYNHGYKAGHHDTVEAQYTDIHWSDMMAYHQDDVQKIINDNTKVFRMADAAPELLEALNCCIECLDNNGFGKAYAQEVSRVAIAKARGPQ